MDQLSISGDVYLIVRFSGSGLFRFRDYGLETQQTTTAGSGSFVRYAVSRDRLTLTEVCVRGRRHREAPVIFGVEPRVLDRLSLSYVIERELEFTGALVAAGGGLRDEGRSSPRFAWAYRRVLEITFEGGLLSEQIDHSDGVDEIVRTREVIHHLDPLNRLSFG